MIESLLAKKLRTELTKTYGERRSYDYYHVEQALLAVDPYYSSYYTHRIVRDVFRFFCQDEILPKDNYFHEPLYEAVVRFMKEYKEMQEMQEMQEVQEVQEVQWVQGEDCYYYSDPKNDFIIIYNKEY